MTGDNSSLPLPPLVPPQPRRRWQFTRPCWLRLPHLPDWCLRDRPAAAALAWAVVLGFMILAIIKLTQVGLMVRPAMFAWSEPVRIHEDVSNAFGLGNMVLTSSGTRVQSYGQMFAACKTAYDKDFAAHPDQGGVLDYPPLRLFTITAWVWHVQHRYPDLHTWPFGRHGAGGYDVPVFTRDAWQNKTVRITEAQIAAPLLMLNTLATAVASLGMLALVWVWMLRSDRAARRQLSKPSPKDIWQWGDWLLLLPVIVLLIGEFIRPFVSWQPAVEHFNRLCALDQLIISPGFWIFAVLRFVATISLVRFLPKPIRAPLCGLLAAAVIWLNPGLLLDSHGWLQMDVWVLPFFILAALACSINRWTTAGVLLGLGCMLKGQMLLVAPMLILCPLLAGWPWRFMRILGGFVFSTALVVWPWFMSQRLARDYALSFTLAAGLMFLLTRFAKPVRVMIVAAAKAIARRVGAGSAKHWQNLHPRRNTFCAAVLIAFALLTTIVCLGYMGQAWAGWAIMVLAAVVLIAPWFMPRRAIPGWLALVVGGSMWIGGFIQPDKQTWYHVGFTSGTAQHQAMTTEHNMSNLCSIMLDRFNWHGDDVVTTVKFPGIHQPVVFTTIAFTHALYLLTLLLCTIGAALHWRRNDPKALAALVAPWVLYPALLPQMTARCTVLPACMAACLLGISTSLSLLQGLLTLLCCFMLGYEMLARNGDFAPLTKRIISGTHADVGWLLLLLAALFLYQAVAPWRRPRLLEQLP